VFVKINGELHYLWRAVDHEGAVLDCIVTKKRDKKAAKKVLKKLVKRYGKPHEIVTDKLKSYRAALKILNMEHLQNPFYFGEMLIKGERHPHRYEPLISRKVFNTCQKVLNTRGNTKAVKETKYPFLYRGLMQCGTSGRQVTCDLKKGRYFYLICRDPDDADKKIWIKQEGIDEQIKRALRSLQLPKGLINEVNDYISEADNAEKIICENLSIEINELDRQVDKLTQLLIDDAITHDIYERKLDKLRQKRAESSALIENYNKGGEDLSDALKTLLSIAHSSFNLFNSSKTPLKRELLILLFSNLQLTRCNLQYTLREPFHSVRKMGENLLWRPVRDLNPCCLKTVFYKRFILMKSSIYLINSI